MWPPYIERFTPVEGVMDRWMICSGCNEIHNGMGEDADLACIADMLATLAPDADDIMAALHRARDDKGKLLSWHSVANVYPRVRMLAALDGVRPGCPSRPRWSHVYQRGLELLLGDLRSMGKTRESISETTGADN